MHTATNFAEDHARSMQCLVQIASLESIHLVSFGRWFCMRWIWAYTIGVMAEPSFNPL